ncbi:MaoC family dehydratase [Rhizobium sp. L1K21]|uniref:MaoC family dehydratase n=1 Tax=Rhizobium sp. L1K21 TaxID=2954933 RepID=UPI002092DCC7|nr:MaoC family dehydratase [Rhizobium sp. L1K21]MCO6185456.1 MaoC family dehydratase [Rhizobium sp. L1K21]
MPDAQLMYEDFAPGAIFESDERTVTADEIIEFASEFDPQPMHLDEAAGKASILGGLSASGWHICSLSMSLFFDSILSRAAGEGSPGIDIVEWRRPLLAGDTIRLTTEIKSTRELKSRPGIGMLGIEQKITNDRNQTVMRLECSLMVRMRNGGLPQ